ncbi:MAG: hypothetical protein CME63_01670 [Halobacteriovoraceae bacterium]|nr:hypothetical protein [Halobacteriovoraceae bacterium]
MVPWESEQAKLQAKSVCNDFYNQLIGKIELNDLHKLNLDKLTRENQELKKQINHDEQVKALRIKKSQMKILRYLK